MRKIILQLAVSLDNYIEGPNGEYDWCFTDQDYGMKEFMERIDAIFYGRKSYEMMMKFEGGNPFASKKSYVFSNTLKSSTNEYELITGDVVEAVKKLQSTPGKDIWHFGGASLTTTLLNANLIDELILAVHPIILGKGKPLFTDIERRIETTLIKATPYPSGLVMLQYHIKK